MVHFPDASAQHYTIYQDEIPKLFKDVEKVEVLSGKMRLFEDAITNLPKLSTLKINDVHIMDMEPSCFKNLPRLAHLCIKECELFIVKNNVLQGITNLKTVDFSRNHIHIIESQAFHDLEQLELVNLGNNDLYEINPRWFKNCTNLQTLILRDNKISYLPARSFKYAKTRESRPIRIILSYNNIRTVSEEAFENLEYIDILLLDHNQIEFLPKNLFENTRALRKLDLTNNRFSMKFTFEDMLQKVTQVYVSGNHAGCDSYKQKLHRSVGSNESQYLLQNSIRNGEMNIFCEEEY